MGADVFVDKTEGDGVDISVVNRYGGSAKQVGPDALRRLIPHSDYLRGSFGLATRGRFPKHLQWPWIRGRTDEFARAFASEELVLLHPDRDRSFDRVDVVGFQGASQFFEKSMSALFDRSRIFFGHP